MEEINKEPCAACFKIICLQCGWEAGGQDAQAIQDGLLTACPQCGWKPGR